MATYGDLRDDFIALFEALGPRTRMGSDWRNDLERIPAGDTRYQLRIVPAARDLQNSAIRRLAAIVEVQCAHMLADPAAERAYTEGQMWTDLNQITDQAWWLAMPSVYSIAQFAPSTIERTVNVVHYTVTIELTLVV